MTRFKVKFKEVVETVYEIDWLTSDMDSAKEEVKKHIEDADDIDRSTWLEVGTHRSISIIE